MLFGSSGKHMSDIRRSQNRFLIGGILLKSLGTIRFPLDTRQLAATINVVFDNVSADFPELLRMDFIDGEEFFLTH